MKPRAALATLLLTACASSSAPPPAAPASPAPPPAADPADPAAVPPTPPPPPAPAIPDAVRTAPAWIFRYQTAQRSETWTLRLAAGDAYVEVQTAQGLTRYLGRAADGASIPLDLAQVGGAARLQLTCKRAPRPLSAACNDTRAKPVEVLDCYHPDFAAPMPFGAAPGIEYVVDERCSGYRLISG